MVEVEKITHNNEHFLKIVFKKYDRDTWVKVTSIKGWFKGRENNVLGLPYNKLAEFHQLTKDSLIVWKNDGDTMGALTKGIDTEDIPKNYILPYAPKIPLREHQIVGFNLMMMRNNLLISDQEGIGKTPTALTAIEAKIKHGFIKRALFLTKASLIYDVQNQARKFTDLNTVVIKGTPKERYKMYEQLSNRQMDLVIMNYDLFRTDISELILLHSYAPFDLCVADECHKIKTPTSMIGKLIHKIKFDQVYGMTATPVINEVRDLFNILAFLRFEDKTSYDYYRKYVEYENMGEVKYRKLSELKALLQSNMLRRLKTDVLKDLPPVVFKNVYVELSPAQKKLYKAVEKGDIDNIDFEELDFDEISSELSKFARLCQITESTEIVGGDRGKIGSSKLAELESLLEEITERGEKAIVFSRSKRFTKVMFEYFKQYNPSIISGDIQTTARKNQEVSDRQENVDRFQNDPECKVIFCVIQASAEGITLTSANNVIFTSKHFSPAINGQCIGRAHRFGAQGHSSINVYSIIAEGTIDERIEKLLEDKQHTITATVETPITTSQIVKALGGH